MLFWPCRCRAVLAALGDHCTRRKALAGQAERQFQHSTSALLLNVWHAWRYLSTAAHDASLHLVTLHRHMQVGGCS